MHEFSNCENKPLIFDGCGLLHKDFIGFKPNTIWKGVEINSLDTMFKIGRNNTKPVTTYDFVIKELNKMQYEAFNVNLCELNGTDGIYKLIAIENNLI